MDCTETIIKEKERIRKRIWSILEEKKVSYFPKPIWGRIPNFLGSDAAAKKLSSTDFFKEVNVIFANPDYPQRKVRELALRSGKIVVMATPKLKRGFLILDPANIPIDLIRIASTIKGAFKLGKITIDLSNYPVDLMILGSVAVWKNGSRIGKGGGFSDLEYAILKESGWITEKTPLVTTVHPLQFYKPIPMCKHDVPLDYIITPNEVIKTNLQYKKPRGIYWEDLPKEKLLTIPLLQKLLK